MQFITDDPVFQGLDRQTQFNERQRLSNEAQGVDAAIRSGLSGADIGTQDPSAPVPYQPPFSQPASSSTPTMPITSGTPLTATMSGFEGTGVNPSPGVKGIGAAGFGQVIPSTYDGDGSGKPGWAAKYGAANPWMPANHAAYVAAPEETQRRVYDEVVIPNEYAPALQRAGLDVNPLNIATVNFLGPAGGTSFLQAAQSNPNAIAADLVGEQAARNGSNQRVFYDATGRPRTVAEVMQIIGGKGGGGGAPQVPQPNVPGLRPPMGPDYSPVIRSLQNAPGGGRLALQLMGQQGKFDVQHRGIDSRYGLGAAGLGVRTDIANARNGTALTIASGRQQTAYGLAQQRREDINTRLTGTALIKGDIDTARYFASQNGIDLPENLGQDAQTMKRLGVAIRLTHEMYRDDPQAAQRFTQAFLQTGDVPQAYAAGGVPRSNPKYTLVWAQNAAGQMQQFGVDQRNPGAPPIPVGGGQQSPNMSTPAPNSGLGQIQPQPQPAPQPGQQPPGAGAQAPQPGATAPTTLTRPPGGAAGGRPFAFERKIELLVQSGWSRPDATAVATGIKRPVSPDAILRLQTNIEKALNPWGSLKPAELKPLVDQRMAEVLGPDWNSAVRVMPMPGAPRPRLGGLPLAGQDQDARQASPVIGYNAAPMGAPPTASAPQPAPSSIAAAPPPAPPPAQRQPNTVYTTPRGPMKWTGTGWLPAQ